MPNYKQLCTDLLTALKSWSPAGGGSLEGPELERETALIARAEAALAWDEHTAWKYETTPYLPPNPMTDLSPEAQAVLNAATLPCTIREGIAAALRAVADQVVPQECLASFPGDSEWQDGFADANARVRAELLAIADELDPELPTSGI